jgi:hypothetical protein
MQEISGNQSTYSLQLLHPITSLLENMHNMTASSSRLTFGTMGQSSLRRLLDFYAATNFSSKLSWDILRKVLHSAESEADKTVFVWYNFIIACHVSGSYLMGSESFRTQPERWVQKMTILWGGTPSNQLMDQVLRISVALYKA